MVVLHCRQSILWLVRISAAQIVTVGVVVVRELASSERHIDGGVRFVQYFYAAKGCSSGPSQPFFSGAGKRVWQREWHLRRLFVIVQLLDLVI